MNEREANCNSLASRNRADPFTKTARRVVMAIFAKYDGIDGESVDAHHAEWVDVLSVDWGISHPGGGAGRGRRRGAATVEDLMLTVEYEKASPKLQEKCLRGAVIPKLVIEQTATYGGARATYLRYELKNVMITSIQVNASGADEAGPGIVVVGNNFEKIKVTYTEFDGAGSKKGNVEYNWKIEKGSA
jgi:type VI secretion system secreted protein Hcp